MDLTEDDIKRMLDIRHSPDLTEDDIAYELGIRRGLELAAQEIYNRGLVVARSNEDSQDHEYARRCEPGFLRSLSFINGVLRRHQLEFARIAARQAAKR
jgi:hypothetical protein